MIILFLSIVHAGIKNIRNEEIFSFLERSDDEYDLIVMRDVLEHFDKDDIMELAKLVNKVLRTDGKLILQVPNGQSPFVGRIFYGDFTHQNAFTHSSLKQIFSANGFSKIQLKEVTPVPHTFKGKLRLLLWKILKLELKFKEIIISGNPKGYFSPNIIAVIYK